MIVFDIETDGLLPELTKIHSLVLYDWNKKATLSCCDRPGYTPIEEGLEKLRRTKLLIGHNILGFDIPAIQKVFPRWEPKGKVRDTYNIARLIWPEIIERDVFLKHMPKNMKGKYSLESFGFRLGVLKGDFGKTTDWKQWTPDMQKYCEQDVEVTKALWERIKKAEYSEEAIQLEHDFQKIIHQQEKNGVCFDVVKALQLKYELEASLKDLKAKIQEKIPPKEMRTPFTPKVNSKKYGYEKGVTTFKKFIKVFNPASRMQIGNYLIEKYLWEPAEFTPTKRPKLSGEILRGLPYEETPLFADFLEANKLFGQLSSGEKSWLKYVKNGKIHGQMTTNGAITGRCTHQKPNLGQVPSLSSFRGEECRELFYAPEGYLMVGADAEQLELRCLAHYLFPYDRGAYAKAILEGDIHTTNEEAAGLPDRNSAKRFIYALNYGAGYQLLGSIVIPEASAKEQAIEGKRLKQNFMQKIHGFGKLGQDLQTTLKLRKHLLGLDGRKLKPRAEHKALNTLLQSAGGVIMKKANVILWEALEDNHLAEHCMQVLQVHDEYQLYAKTDYAEEVGELAADAIYQAGRYFDFRCPLAGNYKIGKNWKETH